MGRVKKGKEGNVIRGRHSLKYNSSILPTHLN